MAKARSSNHDIIRNKLNSSTRGAVEDAAKLAMSRTNYYIEVEHFLRLIDKLKRGNTRTPGIGESVLKMMTEAWTVMGHDLSPLSSHVIFR